MEITPTPARYSKWKQSEIDYLKNNYGRLSDEEIGADLGRPFRGVMMLRIKLRLLRDQKRMYPYKLRLAIRERDVLRETFCLIADMKALVLMISLEQRQYQKDKLKSELRKLDKLNIHKIIRNESRNRIA
ncbi:MAG: hypothetical protein V4608_14940 [Bacteroidota bacterium]